MKDLEYNRDRKDSLQKQIAAINVKITDLNEILHP